MIYVAIWGASIIAVGIALYVHFRFVRRRELAEIKRFKMAGGADDGSFLNEVGLSPESAFASIALRIRVAVAELAEVPPDAIRASHRFYPDLQLLPFFDSPDFLGAVLTIEEKIGVSIDEELAHAVCGTFERGSVGDLVKVVVDAVGRVASAGVGEKPSE